MKIALIGTHGTGKTALAHQIVGNLKEKGINADFLGEIARDCPLPINEKQTREASEWIIYTQYIKEIEKLKSPEKILVCDRSVLDGYVYRVNLFGSDALLKKFIKSKIKTYDLLFRIPLDKTKLKEDGIRSTSPEFQQAIDNQFDILEKEFGIITIKTSNHEQIVRSILENYTP